MDYSQLSTGARDRQRSRPPADQATASAAAGWRRALHELDPSALMRRLPSVDNLIPALYLRGVSSTQFPEALEAILGPGAAGLSSANIVRLKASWQQDYEQWSRRDLSQKHYVYWWVDGLYFKVRLGDERPCLLIIVGALADGSKELVAIYDGVRESKQSWGEFQRSKASAAATRSSRPSPRCVIGPGRPRVAAPGWRR